MKKITLLLSLLLITSLGFAQDDCTTATVVTEGSYTSQINDAVPGIDNGDDIWFSFTPTVSGIISISVCDDLDDPDTRVFLYDGTPGCGALGASVADDDDGCLGTFESLLTGFGVSSGTEYFIQFDDRWSVAEFDWVLSVGPFEPNDDFANATPVTCGGNYTGDTTNATLDEDGAPDGPNYDLDAPNVWFSYDSAVEGAGDVTVDLCPSAFDTSVLIYTGTSGNLSLVGGNDDNDTVCGSSGGTTRSYTTFTANGTDTYYITVEGWNFTSTGVYDLTITCSASCSPAQANQDCASAAAIAVDGSPNAVDSTCSTTNLTQEPTCEGFGDVVDLWYTFTAPSTGAVDITRTLGTAAAAHVVVYDGSCGSFTELGCSDTVDGTLTVSGMTSGSTYYLQVWNNGSEEGTFDLTLTENTLSAGDFELIGFEYYPNPVNDKLNISAQDNIDQLTVYNMIGQRVMVQNPDYVRAELDMTGLAQGSYFVQVTINGATETIQIIKR